LTLDLPLVSVLDDADAAAARAIAPEVCVELYRGMRKIRTLDERMVMLQRQGRVGFYGSCTGQEAPPIATALAIDQRDWIFPALRESSALLMRGFALDRYVAQVFGCDLDVLKGRQMPSHMSAREANVVSWSSCIGTQLPQAVGAALAAKRRREARISIAFMGDGATSSSDFHSAMNFAAVFRAPCVFICQNNQWSISLPSARQSASESFAIKAKAYGMPGIRVDGNDALAIYTTVRTARARALTEGPTFIECLTYRMGAHSTSDDPSRYRSEAEVRSWAEKDPLVRLRRYLVQTNLWSDAREAELSRELDEQIQSAITRAETRPPPAVRTLFDDVYAKLPWHLVEQRDHLLAGERALSSHEQR
jgi:pyruvate dehydrogenase E1 component alpha subunit/2-oxoisovalerate dehydrogenase E1 component alpha subunit